MNPVVSVVLPVYNCPQYVGEAIESTLGQTFTDFELIIIDDGSKDETPDIIRRFADPRIRFFTQTNRGLAATLNRGIQHAQARYVARQDADDVSRPERIGKQVAFLDAHPDCALVGTWAQIWKGRTPTERIHAHPSENAQLKFELLLNNPFVHSSAMIRKEALDCVGGYCTDGSRQPPEDFELWSRIARKYEVANLPEVLHVYREVEGSMSRLGPSPFTDHLVKICAENIACATGGRPSDPQILNIAALVHGAERHLNGNPDFDVMRDIFRCAAIRVTNDDQGNFAREAETRIDALRYKLWDIRYGHGWRRHVLRAARGAVRLIRSS